MMGRKIIYLTSALLLPVAVFLFLKIFGRNEFQVPPLYQEGSINAPGDCNVTYPVPYTVADSALTEFGIDGRDSLYLMWFDPALDVSMRRVATACAGKSVKLLPAGVFQGAPHAAFFRRCVLLLQPPSSLVLLDHRNRIRGYYNGDEREELDRLLVEIDIILRNY